MHGQQAGTTIRVAGKRHRRGQPAGSRHGQQDWGKRQLKRNLFTAVSARGRGNSSADSFGAVVPEEVGLLSVAGGSCKVLWFSALHMWFWKVYRWPPGWAGYCQVADRIGIALAGPVYQDEANCCRVFAGAAKACRCRRQGWSPVMRNQLLLWGGSGVFFSLKAAWIWAFAGWLPGNETGAKVRCP